MYGLGSNETSIPISAHIINNNVISILFLSSFTAWFSFRMCMWWVRCVGFSLDKLSKQHNIDNGSNNQDDRLTPPPHFIQFNKSQCEISSLSQTNILLVNRIDFHE